MVTVYAHTAYLLVKTEVEGRDLQLKEFCSSTVELRPTAGVGECLL